MSRTKLFHWDLWVKFNPLERAFVTYYATRYGKDKREIVRGMVRKYAESDKTFDPDAFLRSVEKVLIPDEKDDKMMQEEIRTQAREYVGRRGKSERVAPTTQSLTRIK